MHRFIHSFMNFFYRTSAVYIQEMYFSILMRPKRNSNGIQTLPSSNLIKTSYTVQSYIPGTINIWKKVLTKAIWAGFWQISLYIK